MALHSALLAVIMALHSALLNASTMPHTQHGLFFNSKITFALKCMIQQDGDQSLNNRRKGYEVVSTSDSRRCLDNDSTESPTP